MAVQIHSLWAPPAAVTAVGSSPPPPPPHPISLCKPTCRQRCTAARPSDSTHNVSGLPHVAGLLSARSPFVSPQSALCLCKKLPICSSSVTVCYPTVSLCLVLVLVPLACAYAELPLPFSLLLRHKSVSKFCCMLVPTCIIDSQV